MTRIAGVSARAAGLGVQFVYFFTRRHLVRLTRRETARTLEPDADPF